MIINIRFSSLVDLSIIIVLWQERVVIGICENRDRSGHDSDDPAEPRIVSVSQRQVGDPAQTQLRYRRIPLAGLSASVSSPPVWYTFWPFLGHNLGFLRSTF